MFVQVSSILDLEDLRTERGEDQADLADHF